jgi:hypothetical protein
MITTAPALQWVREQAQNAVVTAFFFHFGTGGFA